MTHGTIFKRTRRMLEIVKPEDTGIIIATITGEAGIGKTSLACTFPKPIVIRSEDGLKSVPIASRPDALELVEDADHLFKQLAAILKEDHDYKTLIIDSITQLDQVFTDKIISEERSETKTLATAMGGYGAGFNALSAMHGRVRKYAQAIHDKRKMNIIFVAHTDMETIDLPDQDPYSRYSLRIHKKSLKHYVDNVDLVGHIKLDMVVKGKDKIKKAGSNGSRYMVAYTTANCVSKNRYGISDDIQIEMGKNPLQSIIK